MFTDLLRAELLVSAFYAEIEPRTGVLTYCRAGHPMPLLMQDGASEWLDTRGLLLGLNKDGEFEERSIRVKPGSRILFYTDGLVEAKNAAGEDFGTAGVERAAVAAMRLAPQDMAARVVDAVREHAAGSPLADDATAVALRFGPPGEGR